MSYTTSDVFVMYSGNGSDVTFAIPFSFATSTQVLAKLYNATDPTNIVEVPFNKGVDYDVDGTNIVTNSPVSSDYKLLVYRDTPGVHPTTYNTYQFPYQTANLDLDRIYQLCQELKDTLNRAIMNPLYEYTAGEQLLTFQEVKDTVDSVQEFLSVAEDHENRITDLEAAVDTLTPVLYFGGAPNTDGTGRIRVDNGEIKIEIRESGSWVPKMTL